jgi:hypothetical protein
MDQAQVRHDETLHHRLASAVRRNRVRIREADIARREERHSAALAEVDRLVARFREIDPELGRIVLFGSLAHGVPRNPDFDIDLSFEGTEYYRCVAEALNSRFKVDLIDYRVAADHIREAIDGEGRVVYAPDA